MNAAFIVTSAICTNLGIFDIKTRIQQTNRTLCSIQDYAPNSKIIFIEGGEKPNDQYTIDFFKDVKSKVYLFGFSNQLGIPKNFGASKSLNDVVLTKIALEALINNNKNKIDRIFRISGRYQLSPIFDLETYKQENIKNKFVFKTKAKSYIPNSKIKYCYQSRLWSFPYDKAEKAMVYLDNMIKDLSNALQTNEYLDFEHVLFNNIPEDEAKELDLIHVFGVVTSNGYIVYD